ncbi:contact-dependent growth inhibition system immunity protein [Phytopseudomonas dryadis]|uniref:DUF1436 domain-containing protein n=1 Tax=Phytopseudomonas dryadis TaxID=2487520 RepID=A0A4Q9QNA0_9GAMM|nr:MULTISPECIES: contact-dependent growth inhibition system immunity protein [Pseudomonas]TBU81445.1 hypothetical protein DNK44_26180 [Pseudomonas dryadis]TBV08482.1 hypothetical protein DNK34_04250 [Pseudomonas dryadis]TBV18851.1 hypothetical protein DNK41_05675 [Pseudomonas sp. FRB 230]
MNDLVKMAWANAKMNREFLCVQTYSGYGSCRADYKGAMHLLSVDASNQVVGEALLDALSKSRFVLPEPRNDVWIHPEATFDSELYDFEATEQRHKNWTQQLMSRYGYKNKRSLFKDMKNCSVEKREGLITMRPSHHEKLEGWSGKGLSENDYVVIATDCSPEDVGAALLLALSRCT